MKLPESETLRIARRACRASGWRWRVIDRQPPQLIEISRGRHRVLIGPWRVGFYPGNSHQSAVCSDKWWTAQLLHDVGLHPTPTVPVYLQGYRTFQPVSLRAQVAAVPRAWRWPVIVKPNSKSLGVGVQLAWSVDEVVQHLQSLTTMDTVALVQPYRAGWHEYRLFMVNGAIAFWYQKTPPAVCGTGQATVIQLVRQWQEQPAHAGLAIDRQLIAQQLKTKGMVTTNRLPLGQIVQLRPQANLSCGGQLTDLQWSAPAWLQRVAKQVVRSLDVAVAGIDLLARTPIATQPQAVEILEVNANPSLAGLVYAGQATAAVDIYKKILNSYHHSL